LILNRFTKTDRILKRSDFLAVSLKGSRVYNKYFILIYIQNENKKKRLGITVTKRVGNSVERNKIKRYCREFFRLNRCIIPENIDINIIAKKNALALDSEQMFQALDNIFKKIK
jgi:ribonuclease P protein component